MRILGKNLVIMAAGAGSRFGGSKQLAGIGPSGATLMEYSVYDAIKAGFSRIIFVIRPDMEGEMAEMIGQIKKQYPTTELFCATQSFAKLPDGTGISPMRTKPLGTVHALLSAAQLIDGAFAVINADDYYGRQSFQQIIGAMDEFRTSADAALISFMLKNTLSPHGAVTRGICDVENGCLTKIREAYAVAEIEEIGCVEMLDDKMLLLSPDTPVSMNFWAFHKDVLTEAEKYFSDFLKDLDSADNKSECLLPVMAESLIEQGKLRVSVYPTLCRWFGLTYRDDATDAAWELDKRHADGTYPERLF